MGDVLKFRPANYADNPDAVLTEAAGVYETVIVIGLDKNGDLDCRGSTGDAGDILWLIENFKRRLLAGEYGG